jgi:hypothetical protein
MGTGCFHVVNRAAMKGMYKFLFLWCTYPGVELLDHIKIPCLIFLYRHIGFHQYASFYTPTNSTQGSNFSTSLLHLLFCLFFDNHHFPTAKVGDAEVLKIIYYT